MTLFRWADQASCVRSVAARLGVEHSYAAIQAYVLQNATPGITKQETLDVLNRVGRSTVLFNTYDPGSTRTNQTISTRFCLHPLNNLLVLASFDVHLRLVSIRFAGSDS